MKTPTTLITMFCRGMALHAQLINVPGDQPTIQAGDDAASPPWRIVLRLYCSEMERTRPRSCVD